MYEISKPESMLQQKHRRVSHLTSVQSLASLSNRTSGNVLSPIPSKSKRNGIKTHLSPTGILNQLDQYKCKWIEMKSSRLAEEQTHETSIKQPKKGISGLSQLAKQTPSIFNTTKLFR